MTTGHGVRELDTEVLLLTITNRCPIDLVGDRETGSFCKWIEEHKKVRSVSRDRSTDYSAAITASNRQITEVADKFHLIKNITDRMTRLVAENYADYRKAIRDEEKRCEEETEPTIDCIGTGLPAKAPDSREIKFKEVKGTAE